MIILTGTKCSNIHVLKLLQISRALANIVVREYFLFHPLNTKRKYIQPKCAGKVKRAYTIIKNNRANFAQDDCCSHLTCLLGDYLMLLSDMCSQHHGLANFNLTENV